MDITVRDILAFLDKNQYGYSFVGSTAQRIVGFSDPASYRRDTAVWLGATKYLKLGETMSFGDVGLLFCDPHMEDADKFPNRILCEDPRNTFLDVVEHFTDSAKEASIAPTAFIAPSAVIGENVTIGHFAVIEDEVTIGNGTYIGNAVTIHKGCTIGQNCAIYDHTVVGVPGYGFRQLPDGSHRRLVHLGSVLIGDDVEIGALCVIDRGTFKDTTICSGAKIDAKCYIAHNVEIGEHTMLMSSCIICGNCRIGAHAELIGVRCKNRINIGDGVKAGIGSVILFDVPDDRKVFGYPAKKMSF